MKRVRFLSRLRKEGKLELVEPSEEMKESYLKKSHNCLKSAKILLQNDLYENSVTEAYYSMYNSLLALLYKIGIKSVNHSASIILLKKLFKARDLLLLISSAKEERIDKQYYIESEQRHKVTEASCSDMIVKAEDFTVGVRLLIERTNNEDMNRVRDEFRELL